MRACQPGCMCKRCIFDAYIDWMSREEDEEVLRLIHLTLFDENEIQDVVSWDLERIHTQ